MTLDYPISIRKFIPSDAGQVSEIIHRALNITNSPDYSEENIRFMIDYFSPQTIMELSSRREMLVAVSESAIAGTGSLSDDTVYTLFVDPYVQGKGIGTRLMAELEKLAKAKYVSILKVPSSITAVPFYVKLGFIKEKEILMEKSGPIIHMAKQL